MLTLRLRQVEAQRRVLTDYFAGRTPAQISQLAVERFKIACGTSTGRGSATLT